MGKRGNKRRWKQKWAAEQNNAEVIRRQQEAANQEPEPPTRPFRSQLKHNFEVDLKAWRKHSDPPRTRWQKWTRKWQEQRFIRWNRQLDSILDNPLLALGRFNRESYLRIAVNAVLVLLMTAVTLYTLRGPGNDPNYTRTMVVSFVALCLVPPAFRMGLAGLLTLLMLGIGALALVISGVQWLAAPSADKPDIYFHWESLLSFLIALYCPLLLPNRVIGLVKEIGYLQEVGSFVARLITEGGASLPAVQSLYPPYQRAEKRRRVLKVAAMASVLVLVALLILTGSGKPKEDEFFIPKEDLPAYAWNAQPGDWVQAQVTELRHVLFIYSTEENSLVGYRRTGLRDRPVYGATYVEATLADGSRCLLTYRDSDEPQKALNEWIPRASARLLTTPQWPIDRIIAAEQAEYEEALATGNLSITLGGANVKRHPVNEEAARQAYGPSPKGAGNLPVKPVTVYGPLTQMKPLESLSNPWRTDILSGEGNVFPLKPEGMTDAAYYREWETLPVIQLTRGDGRYWTEINEASARRLALLKPLRTAALVATGLLLAAYLAVWLQVRDLTQYITLVEDLTAPSVDPH